jgi:hypothetical protein
MPAPLVGAAVAAAARMVSKKLAQRAVGGITGAGSKNVNPVYREVGPSVKVVKPTSAAARARKNADSADTARNTVDGTYAQRGAFGAGLRNDAKKALGKPAKTIKINSK